MTNGLGEIRQSLLLGHSQLGVKILFEKRKQKESSANLRFQLYPCMRDPLAPGCADRAESNGLQVVETYNVWMWIPLEVTYDSVRSRRRRRDETAKKAKYVRLTKVPANSHEAIERARATIQTHLNSCQILLTLAGVYGREMGERCQKTMFQLGDLTLYYY